MNTKVKNLDYKSKTYSNKEIRQNKILQNVGNYLEDGVIARGPRLKRYVHIFLTLLSLEDLYMRL